MDRIARAVTALTGWPRVAAALAAGGLFALALAPVDAFPILFVMLPVFVWLLDGAAGAPRRPRRERFGAAAALGWCFGFGYFLGGLWWIGAAFLVDGDQFAWLLPIAVTILPAGLALFWRSVPAWRPAWRPGWRAS
jgi:apolipoprotein N-acyltransferase